MNAAAELFASALRYAQAPRTRNQRTRTRFYYTPKGQQAGGNPIVGPEIGYTCARNAPCPCKKESRYVREPGTGMIQTTECVDCLYGSAWDESQCKTCGGCGHVPRLIPKKYKHCCHPDSPPVYPSTAVEHFAFDERPVVDRALQDAAAKGFA